MELTVACKLQTTKVYHVKPVGKLNSNTYAVLEEKVATVLLDRPHTIVFDMIDLDYISSMGVRVIAKTQKQMKSYGGKVVLLHLQPQIKKVFDIIQALPASQLFASTAELDAYLDRMQKKVVDG